MVGGMRIKKHKYILVILMFFTISGCLKMTKDLSYEKEFESNFEVNDTYPVEVSTSTSEYDSYPLDKITITPTLKLTQVAQPLNIPDPDPNNGIVVGTLISKTTLEPMPFITIYMANKVPLEPGSGYVIAFQEKSSPKAITNELGEFIIISVLPDEYIPLMVTPFGTFPLLDLESKEIEMEITKGVVYELGEIFVNWP